MPEEQDTFNVLDEPPLPEKTYDIVTIRNKARELRDSYLRKTDLENQLKQVNAEIVHVERHELIDMFDAAGISSITVDPDGNHPAFVAERATVYGGKIPDERRMEAFSWLETAGHGDLVKSVITIQFGMQEHDKRLAVMKLLNDHHVEYYANESIHHMTLKAFIKHEVQSGHVFPMDLLGAYVFDEVKIK